MATRNKAAYWTLLLSWTVMRIAKAEMAMQMPNTMNPKRWRLMSEKVAMSIDQPKAAAQGGTECS